LRIIDVQQTKQINERSVILYYDSLLQVSALRKSKARINHIKNH